MDREERLNDPDEMMRQAFGGLQARLWTALPGIIQSVDLGAQTCTVQPTIQGENDGPDGSVVNVTLPLLLDCPIVFPRAGGFAVTFPIAQGDEVLVVFASRCIDAWWQSGQVQPAPEFRMHDLSDGFVIPGPTSQPRALSGVSSTNMQMRTEDGSAFIELTPAGGVRIVCTSYEVVSSGGASVEAATALALAGATLAIDSAAAAEVNAPGLNHNGVSIGATHKHSGVQTGPSNTGNPI